MINNELNEKPEEKDRTKLLEDIIVENAIAPVGETQTGITFADKKKIVVVDDEQNIAILITKSIEQRFKDNIQINSFTMPSEALNFCVQDTPDLILLDLRMPEINGLQFIEQLKSKFNIDNKILPKFMLMTGGALPIDISNFVEGIDAILINKPFSLLDLVKKVERRLSKYKPPSALELLDDLDFLVCSDLDTLIGVDVEYENNYDKLAHACNNLITNTITNLENFERFNKPQYQVKAEKSFDYLKTMLLDLSPESLRKFNVFKYATRKGGSSISERGVRIFIKKSDAGYLFIRNIYDRKGIPHFIIDQIRAQFSKEYYNSEYSGSYGRFNVPRRYISPKRELDCTWSVEEAIMGPDLGYVFEKIKTEIKTPKDGTNKRTDILKSLKSELISKCIDDLKYWQETARPIDSDLISKDPEAIANYFKAHIAEVVNMPLSKRGVEFTPDEIALWQSCVDLFNVRNLDLSHSTIVSSLDATPMNVVLKMKEKEDRVEKLTPSIDDIFAILTNEDETISKKELNNRLYHVDLGFNYSHFLEDFFHFVDSFEAKDAEEDEYSHVQKNLTRFSGFIRRSGYSRSNNKRAFFLMGFYRNIRKIFLTITAYHSLNYEFRDTAQIKDRRFNIDRKKYEEWIKHHTDLARVYLENVVEKYKRNIADLQKHSDKTHTSKYESLNNKLSSIMFNENNSLGDMRDVIAEAKILLEQEKRPHKKYLSNIMNMGMSCILSKLVNKFNDVKLPVYSENGGDAHE